MGQRSRTSTIIIGAVIVVILAVLIVALRGQNIGSVVATPTEAVAAQPTTAVPTPNALSTPQPATRLVPTQAQVRTMVLDSTTIAATAIFDVTATAANADAGDEPTDTPPLLATATIDLEPVSAAAVAIVNATYADEAHRSLVLDLTLEDQDEIDHLNVSFIDQDSNSKVREYLNLIVQPTFTLDLTGLPSASYDLVIEAVSAAGKVLARAATPFAHTAPPTDVLPTSDSTQVATLPVIVRSSSGQEIGRGSIRLYAPNKVVHGQSVSVELELYFDALAITPTPAGAITLVPVLTPKPTIERTANPVSSATPRELRLEKAEITIYERMGASLLCSAASFSGCDVRPDPADVHYLLLGQPAIWRWFIVPSASAKGNQQLGIQLWSIVTVNNAAAPQVMWSDTFTIEIVDSLAPASGLSGGTLAIIGVALIALIAAGGVILMRSSRNPLARLGKPRVTVFISYRRTLYWAVADVIREQLTHAGANVFLDRDSIYEGRFEQIIKKAIEERDFFLILIGPKTFESMWVLKEAQIALAANKRIIPVLVDNFNIASDPLPAGMEPLRELNAINLSPEYRDEAIARIAKFIGLVEVKE